MSKLNYTISDDYVLNVSIGNGHHGGNYFCGKFDSKKEAEEFYKNIKENPKEIRKSVPEDLLKYVLELDLEEVESR